MLLRWSAAPCRKKRAATTSPSSVLSYGFHCPLRSAAVLLFLQVCTFSCVLRTTVANPDAKRLYDDLMSSYNRLIRPVGNNSDRLTVKMGLKLSQLIEVVSAGGFRWNFFHPRSSFVSSTHSKWNFGFHRTCGRR